MQSLCMIGHMTGHTMLISSKARIFFYPYAHIAEARIDMFLGIFDTIQRCRSFNFQIVLIRAQTVNQSYVDVTSVCFKHSLDIFDQFHNHYFDSTDVGRFAPKVSPAKY